MNRTIRIGLTAVAFGTAMFASSALSFEGVYTLAVRHAGLMMQTPGRANINLQPVFTDAFAGAILGVIKFSRDARGAVTGFTANSDGARGLRFERIRK